LVCATAPVAGRTDHRAASMGGRRGGRREENGDSGIPSWPRQSLICLLAHGAVGFLPLVSHFRQEHQCCARERSMRAVLEIPLSVSFFTVACFTDHQCFFEDAPATELLTHLAEIIGKVPILAESGLSKVDCPLRDRPKSPVAVGWHDLCHFRTLQEHKSEKLPIRQRHRTMTVESPQPRHIVGVIPPA
jgi:hypothetical protein